MAVPARAGENVPGAGGSGRVSMATEGYFLRLDWICLVERERGSSLHEVGRGFRLFK